MNQYPPRFFLSAQTPLGFVSRLSLLADPDRFPRVWLLKGGTRAKRSALIVRLAETAEESGQQVCRVLDPLAPMLLEAAFWDGFSVIDAAGPHPIEPRYPGAVERVVWLGECWDEQELAALRRTRAEQRRARMRSELPRVAIMGYTNAGKSTLLKLIDGTLTPTAGHVNIGKTVKFAVLSQRLDELEKLGKYKIKEVLSRYKPSYIVDGKEVTPGQLMERLGFESAQLMTPIRDLSGGQKRRMQLLLILLDEPNVLIMDEPGNDLDTDMLAVMEDLLDTWPGTLIVVSHDRYLLERVTDQQFALIGGKVRHLPGGVQDYLDMVEAIKNGKGLPADTPGFAGTGSSSAKSGKGKAAAVNAAASLPQSASRIAPSSEGANNGENSTSKLTGKAFHEASKRVNAIERKLAKLEEQKADLEAQMAAHDPSDYEGLNKLNEQLTAVNTESDDLEAEWLELSEQLE